MFLIQNRLCVEDNLIVQRVSEARRLWPSAPFFKIRLNSFKITLAFFLIASVYFMVADRKNYKVTTYVQNIVVDTFSPLLVLVNN